MNQLYELIDKQLLHSQYPTSDDLYFFSRRQCMKVLLLDSCIWKICRVLQVATIISSSVHLILSTSLSEHAVFLIH